MGTDTDVTDIRSAASLVNDPPRRLTRDESEALGTRMQSLAARQAAMDHDFCDLIDQFDRGEALCWFDGLKSVAHWVAWACSMSHITAREHVRVARALRTLPRVKQLFAEGRFSYSKVRELTRIADLMDEEQLCELALEMTASQLARTVSAYRSAAGTRIKVLDKRRFSMRQRPDGMVSLEVVLTSEEAALIEAAVESAGRRVQHDLGHLEPSSEPGAQTRRAGLEGVPERPQVPRIDKVTALLDLASGYLDNQPSAPADDHTLVMVHVSADQLTTPITAAENVPAGTSGQSGIAYIEGQGPIEAATAQRLACTATLVGAIVDRTGDVLALGRTTRLATRAQRRALRIRDQGICQFPGCTTAHHLDAHHLEPWSQGGRTDLDNLVLLCRRHHVFVHEGGLTITTTPDSPTRFAFAWPDGRPVTASWTTRATELEQLWNLSDALERDPEPTRIFPKHAGAGFSLHNCVEALFQFQLEPFTTAA